MDPWINYHHLYYFKAIAEQGSVSKAAKLLRLGQPTLSAQLKQFEENIGVALFERQHKRLILTEQGKVALDYAKNIFKMGSEMYEVLHDRLTPNRVSLHIGALDTVAKQVVVQLVEKALKVSPCQISLSEGSLDYLTRELVSHRLDLLLTNRLPTNLESRGLLHRRIARENVAIYGAPEYRKLRKKFPESIAGQPFILPSYDSQLRHDFTHWCKTKGLTIDVLAEGQDIAVKKLMAIKGLGLIPVADHTVQLQVLAGQLIKIGVLKDVYEELILVSADRRIKNPVGARLMKSFRI